MYFNKNLYRALALALAAALLTACGGGRSASAPTEIPGAPTLNELPVIAPTAERNQLAIYVDAGPADTGYNVNRLYTDVTICFPGKSSPGSPTQCQTIDHVLVDTGSSGLRLLASAMTPALKLNRLSGSAGLPLLNCAQFVDLTYTWGPVAVADVVLGGKTAVSVPIQVIADPASASLGAACSGSSSAITTASTLGANGILGLGLFKDDCGADCAISPHNGSYYTCSTDACTATVGATASTAKQVKNPVPLFAADNNGLLFDLPATSAAGSPSLNGSLIFGIGTQPNNQASSATVLSTNSAGHITTLYSGRTMSSSFIDSGSNGLFFESAAIDKCGSAGAGFYCPKSPTNVSATLVGVNGVSSPVLSFPIGVATELFGGGVNHVLPTLGGDLPDQLDTFDWGLPFFLGRRVFFGIDGQASSAGIGPFYAF